VAIVKVPLEQGAMSWGGPRGVWALTNQTIQWVFQEFFREGRFSREHPYF
jgi:hypothetical protein